MRNFWVFFFVPCALRCRQRENDSLRGRTKWKSFIFQTILSSFLSFCCSFFSHLRLHRGMTRKYSKKSVCLAKTLLNFNSASGVESPNKSWDFWEISFPLDSTRKEQAGRQSCLFTTHINFKNKLTKVRTKLSI